MYKPKQEVAMIEQKATSSGKKKLGDLLIQQRMITSQQLQIALADQVRIKQKQGVGKPIGMILVDRRFINPRALLRVTKAHGCKVPLGELMVIMGFISCDDLCLALKIQRNMLETKKKKYKIGQLLVYLSDKGQIKKNVTNDVLLEAIAAQNGWILARPSINEVQHDILFAFHKDILLEKKIIPYRVYQDEGKKSTKQICELIIVDCERSDLERVKTFVRGVLAKKELIRVDEFVILVISETSFRKHLDSFFDRRLALATAERIDDSELSKTQTITVDEGTYYKNDMMATFAKIVREALLDGASDIHIEPDDESMTVRYRIDGILIQKPPLPKSLCKLLPSSITSAYNLTPNYNEGLPLDADIKASYQSENMQAVLRLSFIPVGDNWRSMVIRILLQEKKAKTFAELGMPPTMLRRFTEMIKKPQGVILAVGPTGSGKSTLLYSALEYLKCPEKKLVTVEKPIEYRIPGVMQFEVTKKLPYEAILQHLLRHDPDVIVYGEINNEESARAAISAALTGHLLLSTLHTDTAVDSINRLVDLGVERFLLQSTLLVVVAQRLLRRICQHCKEAYTPDPSKLVMYTDSIADFSSKVESGAIKFYRGAGCPRCHHTGYRGRIGVYEILCVSDRLKKEIFKPRVTPQDIMKVALETWYTPLYQSAIPAILGQITTVDEVYRVIGMPNIPTGLKKRSIKEILWNLQGKISDKEVTQSISEDVTSPFQAKKPAVPEMVKSGLTGSLSHTGKKLNTDNQKK